MQKISAFKFIKAENTLLKGQITSKDYQTASKRKRQRTHCSKQSHFAEGKARNRDSTACNIGYAIKFSLNIRLLLIIKANRSQGGLLAPGAGDGTRSAKSIGFHRRKNKSLLLCGRQFSGLWRGSAWALGRWGAGAGICAERWGSVMSCARSVTSC